MVEANGFSLTQLSRENASIAFFEDYFSQMEILPEFQLFSDCRFSRLRFQRLNSPLPSLSSGFNFTTNHTNRLMSLNNSQIVSFGQPLTPCGARDAIEASNAWR
jgi:hypothetical protein